MQHRGRGTEEEAALLKATIRRYAANPMISLDAIAEKYGVCRGLISRYLAGTGIMADRKAAERRMRAEELAKQVATLKPMF